MKSQVIIQFEVEGFHNYPEAPSLVSFLSTDHRHSFVVRVGSKVSHLNRQKEIFILRDELKQYLIDLYGSPCLFGSMSCEMIAEHLLHSDPGRQNDLIWVEVWEERTGGARVEL
jgi:hypothetical protein